MSCVSSGYKTSMGVSTIFFIIAAVAAGIETFQTRSFGWGGVTFIALGLAAGSW